MDVVTLDTLMTNLNTELDALGVSLFGESKISRAIPFNIAANTQDSTDKIWTSTVKTPAIGKSLQGSFASSQEYQSYTDRVLVTFYGFNREVDDLMLILDKYAIENTGKYATQDDWIYQLSFEKAEVISREPDEGEERCTIQLEIGYLFLFKGYTSDHITIQINGERVPVRSYTHKLEKEGSTKDSFANGGINQTKNIKGVITKTITFININNTEINKVHEDIDTGTFLNRTYTIFYGLGCDDAGENCDYDNSDDFVLTSGTIDYTEGGFEIITGTFLLSR